MSTAAQQARRLLSAYPWRVRAEQGEEIVGTVLDALPPGARRLPLRTAIDLVRGGWRVRARRCPPWPTALAYSLGFRIGPQWIAWIYDDLEDPEYVRTKRIHILLGFVPVAVVFAGITRDWMAPLYALGGLGGGLATVPRERERRRARYGLVPGGRDPSLVWVRRRRRALVPNVEVGVLLLGTGLLLGLSGLWCLLAVTHQSPNGTDVVAPAPPDVVALLRPQLAIGGLIAVGVAAIGGLLLRWATPRRTALTTGFGVVGAIGVPLTALVLGFADVVVAVGLHWQWLEWTNARVVVVAPAGLAVAIVGLAAAVAGRRRGAPIGLWDVLPFLTPHPKVFPMAWWIAQQTPGVEPWGADDAERT